MSDRLLALATAQHGVVSSPDATRLDVDPNALAALVDAGTLVRVRRGAYVLGTVWAPATPERRLDLRTRAVLHARGRPHEAATHQSALAVHGLPLHDVPLDVVDVCGTVTRVRRASGLRIHPTADLPVETVDGCRTVPVDVALAQLALRGGRDAVVVATDRALHDGSCDLVRVTSLVEQLAESPRRATRALRWMYLADPLSESVGETRTRLMLIDLGHDVRSQVRIADGRGAVLARVDLLVEGCVVVEFDGLVKYEGAEGRAALAAEKVREDRLRALGYEVVRLTWADLASPQRVAALVRAALDRAAARGLLPGP
ncbi:type IV toxin-antitoxin system AbiEi family antitoxin domain-containing protein [Phycicoccus sp. MAQZ13P-2]|uniref:type IV toxin-antitoxin system AbiEi family antitoxin domain-containing protein n=1 Tax=Phycicoccus mangrovi TaxID=2840470 RepID=UPI001C004BB2|nr:type IV toxin-antitoxin system AbiEi family antitoxin domain-containing protein [Phycicoccus mangrovi]MBT9254913.1 type IV toxin-antitoxin system AbiEi family antitoxin domain-containing protein [Phycicoccus mangrovi]MBT9256090.1 type IV toxin-antitoxin system AbiEi family antitoxin domain-containing protein [Phycicoccus mangrovi]MBT9273897.1 type IV toxin-antitoxin system AbiEi family antitoxin domain-containing protein [Phycicoccus mangrovi]